MKRFSILVQEAFSDHEVDLVQVDNDPYQIALELRKKTLSQKSKTKKYTSVRVVENRP